MLGQLRDLFGFQSGVSEQFDLLSKVVYLGRQVKLSLLRLLKQMRGLLEGAQGLVKLCHLGVLSILRGSLLLFNDDDWLGLNSDLFDRLAFKLGDFKH